MSANFRKNLRRIALIVYINSNFFQIMDNNRLKYL